MIGFIVNILNKAEGFIMDKYNYKTHDEIPGHIQVYIMSIADVSDVAELDLDHINDFMNCLETWETEQIFNEGSKHIH